MFDIFDFMAKSFVERGAARLTEVKCTVKSGREFPYNLSDYPFGPEMTAQEIAALVRRIVADKYRDCPWDRSHPTVDVQKEIVEALETQIQFWVQRMRKVMHAG